MAEKDGFYESDDLDNLLFGDEVVEDTEGDDLDNQLFGNEDSSDSSDMYGGGSLESELDTTGDDYGTPTQTPELTAEEAVIEHGVKPVATAGTIFAGQKGIEKVLQTPVGQKITRGMSRIPGKALEMVGPLNRSQLDLIKEGSTAYRSARPVPEIVDEFADLAEEIRGVGKTSAEMADEVIRSQKISVKKSDLYKAYADSLAENAKSIDTRNLSQAQIKNINNVPKGLSRYNKDLKHKVLDSRLAKQVSSDLDVIKNTKTPKGKELLTQLKELKDKSKYSKVQGISASEDLYRDVEKNVRERIAEKNPAYNKLKRQASASFDEQAELKRLLKVRELPQLSETGEAVGKAYNPTAQTQTALKKLISKPDEHAKEIKILDDIFKKYNKGKVLKEAEYAMMKKFVNDTTGLQNIRLGKTAAATWLNAHFGTVIAVKDAYGAKAQEILSLASGSDAVKGAKKFAKGASKLAWKSLPIIGGIGSALADDDPTSAIPFLGDSARIAIPEGIQGKIERGEKLAPEELQLVQEQGRQHAEQQIADVEEHGPKETRYLSDVIEELPQDIAELPGDISDVANEMGESFAKQALKAKDEYAKQSAKIQEKQEKEFQRKEAKAERDIQDRNAARVQFETERRDSAEKNEIKGQNKARIDAYRAWEKARTKSTREGDNKVKDYVTLNNATPEELKSFVNLLKYNAPEGAEILLPMLEKSIQGDDLAKNQLNLLMGTPAIKSIINAAVRKPASVKKEPATDFNKEIIEHTMSSSIEGGFQADVDDKGNYTKDKDGKKDKLIGTNKGITPLSYKAYYGRYPTITEMENLSDDAAKKIYMKNYMTKPKIDTIPNESLRAAVFDFGVTSPHSVVIKKLQKLLKIKADGLIGKNTIKAISNYKGDIYKDFNDARRGFYIRLAKNDPVKRKFLKGWLNRVDHIEKKYSNTTQNIPEMGIEDRDPLRNPTPPSLSGIPSPSSGIPLDDPSAEIPPNELLRLLSNK